MKYQDIATIITRYAPDIVVNTLEPYLTPARQQKIQRILSQRLNAIHIALEAPSDLHNAAAVLRSCEALGILRVHIIGELGRQLYSKRVTQGAYQWLDIKQYDTTADFLTSLRTDGIRLHGASQHGTQPVSDLQVDSLPQPLCLIFGNEQYGLSKEAIAGCQSLFRIPMYGFSESLNLSVSVAISLYDVCQRRRSILSAAGDLTPEQLEAEQAIFYAGNVEKRLLDALLPLDQ